MQHANGSWFERIGEEAKLRPLIEEFVDRCFDDLMIGFLFKRASRSRVKELEYQHAAEWLGAPLRYRGRPLEVAHKPHPILGGHFSRRLHILKEVLEAHQIAPELVAEWLAHQESLRGRVTSSSSTTCDP